MLVTFKLSFNLTHWTGDGYLIINIGPSISTTGTCKGNNNMEWHIVLSQRVLKEGCNVACTLKSSVKKISSTQTWWQLAFSKTGPKIYFLESRRTKSAFKFFHFNVNCLKIINILHIGPFHLPCVFLFEDKKQQLITIYFF